MVAQLKQAISQQTNQDQDDPDLPESVLDCYPTSKSLSESQITTDRESTKKREQAADTNAASELPSESTGVDGELDLISSEIKLIVGELPSSPTTEPDGDENLVSRRPRENTPIVSESPPESPAIQPDSSDLKESLSMETAPSVSDLPVSDCDDNDGQASLVAHERLLSDSAPPIEPQFTQKKKDTKKPEPETTHPGEHKHESLSFGGNSPTSASSIRVSGVRYLLTNDTKENNESDEDSLTVTSELSSESPRELLSDETKENSEKPPTSIESLSEPPSDLLNQPHAVDIIQNPEGTEKIISELPFDERSLQRESRVISEPLDDLPSSPLPTEGNKNSQSVQLQLTGAALARRLNVSPSTLRHKKNARNFGQWTSGHDPDGIAWYFDGQKFVSLLPQ